MPNEIPSKTAVKKAGGTLRIAAPNSQEYSAALDVLSSWRGLFADPLNAFNVLLRKMCKKIGVTDKAIVARRLKRTPSIVAKLRRFRDMDLCRMQDIGGLRVIVPSIEDVYKIHRLLENSRMKHEIVKPCHDYIKNPKKDGYRSLHQVCRYRSETKLELSKLNLLVEVQIRTQVQHAWATAVEALGVIEKSSFKTGEGEQDFRRFFVLSSALLSILEDQPIVEELKGVPPIKIVEEFEALQERFHIFLKLQGVVSVKKVNTKDAAFYIMVLDAENRTLKLWGFASSEAEDAEKFYKFLEIDNRSKETVEVVLVSVDSLKKVQRAYPNYFLDCNDFIKQITEVCQKIKSQNQQTPNA